MAMMNKQEQRQGQVKRPMPGLPINPGGSMMSGDSYTALEQSPPEDDIMELDMEEPVEETDEETAKLDAGFVSADEHCEMCLHMTADGTCQRYGWSVVDGDGCKEGFEPSEGEDVFGAEEPIEEVEEVEEPKEVQE